MRGVCEFATCNCTGYVYRKAWGRCAVCGHGACWHRPRAEQFLSTRRPARTPQYMFVAIGVPVPEAPQYAVTCEALPV